MKKSVKKLKEVVVNRIPGAARLKVPKTWTRTYTSALGELRRKESDGVSLVSYEGDKGFDYDTYKAIQEEGNRAKLHGQWVTRAHIARLADVARAQGVTVRRGVCHGTRQGFEQLWFREALGEGADVFGTEISSTATDFPHTVQWDFHEPNPDWAGRMDLVYSNSWDHAYDPEKAFAAWIGTLAPGGVLMLDHSRYHLPDRANELDPFGAECDALKEMVSRIGGAQLAWVDAIEDRLNDDTTTAPVDLPVVTLVWQRSR
jgi:hypothetical protein